MIYKLCIDRNECTTVQYIDHVSAKNGRQERPNTEDNQQTACIAGLFEETGTL